MDTAGEHRFRADIEGLRGIAVLLVLLFHARLPGFGGGYVGVDVFFVISGFLITRLIVRELQATGRVSLPAFYARRARRLLPAAAVALLATMAASAILLPPLRMPEVAADGAAAALYVANIRFALQAMDYFEADTEPSPFVHYWSLGVEEQFYLLWPALLIAVVAFARRTASGIERPGQTRELRAIVITVGLVAAASFALSVALTRIAQPWAFFSLPAKAWELALGAMLFLLAARGEALRAGWAALFGLAGVGLIVAAGTLLSVDTLYPGSAALLPTVGAALVIAAGLCKQTPWPSRALGAAPLRWLGRISYSLYLWHWPVLVIPAAMLESELPLSWRVGLALLCIPIAAASQRWVEEPIRRGKLVGLGPRPNLSVAAALVLSCAALSLAIGSIAVRRVESGATPADEARLQRQLAITIGAPGQSPSFEAAQPARTPPGAVPADLNPPLRRARQDLHRLFSDGCMVGDTGTVARNCVYGDPRGAKTVVLFGDSHAAQWFPALERLATANHWRLVALTKTQCPAVDHPVWNPQRKRLYTECDLWRSSALGLIADQKPDLVVVSNSVFARLVIDGKPVPGVDREAVWDSALGRTLTQLRAAARHVVLIADTPHSSKYEPPVCLSAHQDDALACSTPLAEAINSTRLRAERDVARAVGATFVDPTRWLCPTEPCPAVIGSVLVYRDAAHMTKTFSQALAPYLAAALPGLGD